MISREKLLEAAVRVYGEVGFRGATTRRIAQEAGVNEVTLFRIFGSKAALIAEALRANVSNGGKRDRTIPSLPDVPTDPERELTLWCAAQLAYLRGARSMIRKTMSEIEEHPELGDCASSGPECAARALRMYLHRLRRRRLIDADVDVGAASAMLLGALFSDAMGRDLMPHMYPQSPEAAARAYARLLLKALGGKAGVRRARPLMRRTARASR
jgi:AcrR family transcriptional regulator